MPPERRNEGKLDIGANVSPRTIETDAVDGVEAADKSGSNSEGDENLRVRTKSTNSDGNDNLRVMTN